MRVAEHRAEPIGNARRAIGLALIESEGRFVAPAYGDAPLNTL